MTRNSTGEPEEWEEEREDEEEEDEELNLLGAHGPALRRGAGRPRPRWGLRRGWNGC